MEKIENDIYLNKQLRFINMQLQKALVRDTILIGLLTFNFIADILIWLR